MTDQLLKKRLKELKRVAQSTAVENANQLKEIIFALQEIQVIEQLLLARKNSFLTLTYWLFGFSVSWPLLLSGYSLGLSLGLVLMNTLFLAVLLSQTRQLIQAIHWRSILFWLLSACGGNLPAWRQYQSKIRWRLVSHFLLFMLWLIPYAMTLPSFTPLNLMGFVLMGVAFKIEYQATRFELLDEFYEAGKLVVSLKNIDSIVKEFERVNATR